MRTGGIAAFVKLGELVVVGDNKGTLTFLQATSLRPVSEIYIKGGASVKSIVVDRTGSDFVVNSVDKTLRIFTERDSGTWELMTEIIDSINRLHWKCVCFSRDSEFTVAGTAELKIHNIYFWMKGYGEIHTKLEGPKEGLMDICVSLRPLSG